jgi:hypothetical protein
MNRRKTTQALLALSGIAILLDFIRGGIMLDRPRLPHLEPFPGLDPVFISEHCAMEKTRRPPRFVPSLYSGCCSPNAPYMVTDIIHVASGIHHVWLDALVFFLFAWTALLLAIISLRALHLDLSLRLGRAWSEAVVVAVCALSSFGVYLGRFQRWNSWDIVTRPWALLSHSYAISTGLANDRTPLLCDDLHHLHVCRLLLDDGHTLCSPPKHKLSGTLLRAAGEQKHRARSQVSQQERTVRAGHVFTACQLSPKNYHAVLHEGIDQRAKTFVQGKAQIRNVRKVPMMVDRECGKSLQSGL